MFILAAVALISITLPLSDTVYLPALLSIQHDLRASSTLVSTSVAIYAIAVGVFSSVWGPASDRCAHAWAGGSRSSGGSDDGDGGEQRPLLLAPHDPEDAGSRRCDVSPRCAIFHRFGRKGVLLTGTALFAALSVACAFAPNITALLVLRGLQGASGGQRTHESRAARPPACTWLRMHVLVH